MIYILATNFSDLNSFTSDDEVAFMRLGDWVSSDLVSGESIDGKFKLLGNFDQIDNDIQQFYELFLSSITLELNKLDSRKFTQKEGRIFYGPWLFHMLSHYFYLYQLLMFVKKKYKDSILVCGSENSLMSFKDTLEHKKNIRYDPYNNLVLKIIAKFIGIKFITSENYLYTWPDSEYEDHRGKYLRMAFSKIEFFINFRSKIFLKNSYINKFDRVKIFFLSIGAISTISNRPEKLNVTYNSQLRSGLNLNIKKDKSNVFIDLILQNIIDEIPICFVEGFDELQNKVKKNYKGWNPNLILSANAWYHDEPFKLWAIFQKRNGAKLIGYQHGGVYLTYRNNFYLRHERSVTDYFLSWGLGKLKDQSIIPFYIQKKIISPKKIKKGNRNEIMLLTNNYSKQHHFLEIFQSSYSSHIEQNCIFLETLNPLYKVRYRPFRTDYGWKEIKDYRKINPSIELSSHKKNVLVELSLSKVVVFDNIHSTSFLESIAMNIPSIILAKDFQNEINKNTLPIFMQLKKYNILFDSGKECADFLNKNYFNIEEWWFSIPIQNLVEEFKSHFAPISKNFSKSFIKELSKIQ
tara:strand:- start:3071 stop:4801 length:1731 start_codon:yes stop_codon:yes gene_type:complete